MGKGHLCVENTYENVPQRQRDSGNDIRHHKDDLRFFNGRSPGSNTWRYVGTICLAIFCGDIP